MLGLIAMSIIFTSATFWNPHVDSKGRTKKGVTRVTPKSRFSLVSNEEPHVCNLLAQSMTFAPAAKGFPFQTFSLWLSCPRENLEAVKKITKKY